MALPNVNIEFENGALGGVAQSADGVVGMLIGLADVTSLAEGKAVCVYSTDCLAKYGITEGTPAHKAISEFYTEAGEGAELWLMAVDATDAAALLAEGKKLLKAANGRIRTLGVVPSEGVAADKITEVTLAAQVLGEWAAETIFAPIIVLLPVVYSDTLPVVVTMTNNRVGLVVGDTVENSNTAMIGVALGRVAKVDVQVHIGRVKDGALKVAAAYIGAEDACVSDAVETLYNNGYIVPRCFVGKSGYFFADDCLATADNDDYRSLARRRVIDKAYRVAYTALLEYVNDNLDVTNEGTLTAMSAKAIEQEVESKIYNSMTAEGNLSTDGDGDTGVKVSVDTTNDVVATNTINVRIQVKPYGYAKFIEVKLGFLKED